MTVSGKIPALCLCFLFSFAAVADTTTTPNLPVIQGGVSNTATVENKLIAYAGMAGACNGTTNCDTCEGGTLPGGGGNRAACNHNSVGMNQNLVVAMTTTNTSLIGVSASCEVKASSKTSAVTTGICSGSGTSFTFSIPWSSLCDYMSSVGCATSFVDTFQMRVFKDAVEEKVEFKLIFSSLLGGGRDTASICAADATLGVNTSPVSNEGFCFMRVEKGDEKVYLLDVNQASTFPVANSGAAEAVYNNLLIYAVPRNGDATTAMNAVTNKDTPTDVLSVATGSSPPLGETRVTGLTNDINYCFMYATQDITGNIMHFANISNTTANEMLCATPEKVFGLLDDKKCFVATAAWGSWMDPHVQVFRDFRDRFLKPFTMGQKFVEAYYEASPDWANVIRSSEYLRLAARVLLWPLLIFAKIALVMGMPLALILMGTGVAVPIWLRRRRQRRGEKR